MYFSKLFCLQNTGSTMPLGASASNFTKPATTEELPKKKTVWPGEEDDNKSTPSKTIQKSKVRRHAL